MLDAKQQDRYASRMGHGGLVALAFRVPQEALEAPNCVQVVIVEIEQAVKAYKIKTLS